MMPETVPIIKQLTGIVKAKSHPQKPQLFEINNVERAGDLYSGYKLSLRSFLWSILAHTAVTAPSSELAWSSLESTGLMMGSAGQNLVLGQMSFLGGRCAWEAGFRLLRRAVKPGFAWVSTWLLIVLFWNFLIHCLIRTVWMKLNRVLIGTHTHNTHKTHTQKLRSFFPVCSVFPR